MIFFTFKNIYLCFVRDLFMNNRHETGQWKNINNDNLVRHSH
jgi:hypothetical protein